jgi:hypothetical protein
MSIVGRVEKRVQARIVVLLRDRLKWGHLGNGTQNATGVTG